MGKLAELERVHMNLAGKDGASVLLCRLSDWNWLDHVPESQVMTSVQLQHLILLSKQPLE